MSRTRLATFVTGVYRAEGIKARFASREDDPWALVGELVERPELMHPNLRTNDGIDWMSQVLGGGPVASSAQLSGTATSTTATSLTNTGAAFPTSGGFGNTASSPLAGKYVVCGSVYGVILSHTATVLSIDRWNQIVSPGGAAGATPANTTTYVIVPAAPTWWMALSSDATTPTAADHTLAGEITSNGLARGVGGWSHTNGTNTLTLNNLFTCTGGSNTVNKEALFNAQNGGMMTFESAEPSPPTLISADTLNQSVVVTY